MSRRDDEEKVIPITRKVTLSGKIGALSPGENSIIDAWVQIGGTRVTEVPIGEEFDIYCHYVSENIGGVTWRSTVTVIGEFIQNFKSVWVSFASKIDTKAKLDDMGANVMPAGVGDLSLNLKVWMHDDVTVDPRYPPISEW